MKILTRVCVCVHLGKVLVLNELINPEFKSENCGRKEQIRV